MTSAFQLRSGVVRRPGDSAGWKPLQEGSAQTPSLPLPLSLELPGSYSRSSLGDGSLTSPLHLEIFRLPTENEMWHVPVVSQMLF